MKNIKDILFIVQARVNSSRVKKKMIRKFANTTLIDICFKKLLKSKLIPKEQIYASLCENELKEIANKNGINIFHRSDKSANAKSTDGMKLIFE